MSKEGQVAEGTIARALRVLNEVSRNGPDTLTAFAERLQLSAPTLLRILRIMAEEGYVVQKTDRRWRGGMVLVGMGRAVERTVGLGLVAQEYTDRLVGELDETAIFAAYESGQMTYIAISVPAKPARTHIDVGSIVPLGESNSGQCVAAYLQDSELTSVSLADEARERLDEIRELGYCAGTGRHWSGVWGVAAPVFGADGRIVGSLGMSAPGSEPEGAADIARAVVAAARDMSEELSGRSA